LCKGGSSICTPRPKRIATTKFREVNLQEQYYTRLGGKVEGPFTFDELAERRSNGKFSMLHEVSVDRDDWFSGSEIMQEIGQSPNRSRKSRRAAQQAPRKSPVDKTPKRPSPPPRPSRSMPSVEWSYTAGGRRVESPIPTDHLRELIRAGEVGEDDRVWRRGIEAGAKVSECAEFADALWEYAQGAGRLSRRLSRFARLTAAVGGVDYALLLVCTVMLVLRMRAAPLVLSEHIGVIVMTSFALVLGIVTAVLGHMAIRAFKRLPGTSKERSLIVFGLSCGYTSVIVILILTIGVTISTSESAGSPTDASHLPRAGIAPDLASNSAAADPSTQRSDPRRTADWNQPYQLFCNKIG
jgi:hypothetical protein